MKRISFYIGLLWLLDVLCCEAAQAAILCPEMPDVSRVNRDVSSDIKGSVGTLGRLKAGEIASKTEVVAKNLFEKYPNMDRVLTVQMMAATYCSLLRGNTSLSDKDRQERWEKFYDRVFSFVGPESSKASLPEPVSRTQSVKKPGMDVKSTEKPSQAVKRRELKNQEKASAKPQDQRASRVPEEQAYHQPAPAAPVKENTAPDNAAASAASQSQQQVTPSTTENTGSATSAPPNIISQDPVKALEAVDRMKANIREAIQNKETITFLISYPKDENGVLVLVSNLLHSACRESPRQCWTTHQGSLRDLDRPPLQPFQTNKRGIIVHGPDANALANALGGWFETYSTSHVPAELSGYKMKETAHLIWIDIGPGSIWKQ